MSLEKREQEEQITQKLRALFAGRGYLYTAIPKFEEYNLYNENKSFLESEHIISFMNMDSKLLALKPDITLSIAKNIPRSPLPYFERLYYIDEVYRLSKENREYQVLHQIGIELMGPVDTFSNVEIVQLALASLALVSAEYLLDISHNGFTSGLLTEAGLTFRGHEAVQRALYSKSRHLLEEALEKEHVPEPLRSSLLALPGLAGPFSEVLPQAKALISNDTMRQAYEELQQLYLVFKDTPHLSLDFSSLGNFDYYNGLVLQGYVRGIPAQVLSGGKYDKLLEKMGKQNGALGFALSLSQLFSKAPEPEEYDIDHLIFYSPSTDYSLLLEAVARFTIKGEITRLEPLSARGVRLPYTYRQAYHFTNGTLESEGTHD